MGVKEDFFEWAFGEAVGIVQLRIDFKNIQEKYGAKRARVIKFEVLDITVAPVFLQLVDGKVNRLKNHDSPDATVTFKHLDTFLDVILIDGTLERIFAYDGRVERNGHMSKEVYFEGDWMTGSVLLQQVFPHYVGALREVLQKSKLFKVIVRPVAGIKGAMG